MRILQITKYYYPSVSFGGPVQCTYNISKYLVKKGHDVTVYATDTADISSNARIKEKFQLMTMMLHAKELSFTHPVTKESIMISAVIQNEFKRMLKLMKFSYES